MKIENRQQFLLVLTLAAAALLVGVNFIYEPLQNLWSARSAQIRELQAKIESGRKLQLRGPADHKRWNNMLTNSLPSNTSMAEQQLFTALDNWRRSSGAEITSLSPQWKSTSTNHLTLHCRVEATGNLGALSQFLYSLEQGPLGIKVDTAELSAHDLTGQQLTLGLQLSGLALPQPAQK